MGQISFTTDIWSDQNRRPYLAITAHWIARIDSGATTSLQLKASLIAFHCLRGSHDGESLAATIIKLLDRAEITVKVWILCMCIWLPVSDAFPEVGHFTMDNASNNETMMKFLEEKLALREIAFDAADRKIMCYGHVVDLSSGRVVRAIAAGSLDNEDDPSPTDDETETATDLIAQARAVVRAIRGSGSRREAFDEVITNGNAKGWFKQGEPPKTVKLDHLQLLRDVRTRWDSVYHMLKRLRELRPVRTTYNFIGS